MPSSAIVHAAVFTVGAVIGAGAAATITYKRQQRFGISTSEPAVTPVVELQKAGTVEVKTSFGGDILKYGNPGEGFLSSSNCSLTESVL